MVTPDMTWGSLKQFFTSHLPELGQVFPLQLSTLAPPPHTAHINPAQGGKQINPATRSLFEQFFPPSGHFSWSSHVNLRIQYYSKVVRNETFE